YRHAIDMLLFFFVLDGDHRYLHSFPTRRSSDLVFLQDPGEPRRALPGPEGGAAVVHDGLGLAVALDGLLEGSDHGIGALGVVHRSEEHTSELQSRENLVCRLLLEKKKKQREVTL